MQAQAEDKARFYSLVKAPETQKILCLLWIRETQAQIQQWTLSEGPETP